MDFSRSSFCAGRHSSSAIVSNSMPKNTKVVKGPSHLGRERGKLRSMSQAAM